MNDSASARPVYVVTGGSRGIGAAVTRRLAQGEPRTIVIAYHSYDAAARSLAAELDDEHHSIVPMQCDVADAAQVEALFQEADAHGPLVGLVNSAAILEHQSPLSNIGAERWARILATNVIGTAMCCRAAVERMRSHQMPPRSIVNISSRAAGAGFAQ